MLNYSTSNTPLTILKVLVSFIFPVYLLLIDYNIRYTLDDFWYLETLREQGGALKSSIWLYLNYEGPFLGFLRLCYLYYLPEFAILGITLFLHISAAWFFVSSLFVFTKTKVSRLDSWLIASTLCSALCFLCMDASCNYHWIVGTAYLCCATYVFWACGFMLRNKPWLALPFFILLMHSRINFAALVFGGYGMLFLYHYFFKRKFNKQMFYSLIIMSIAVAIYLVAPGNWVRSVTSEEIDAGLGAGLKRLFISEYLLHLPHALVFSLAIAFVLPDEFAEKIRLKKNLLFIPFFLVLFFSIINMTLIFLATKTFYYGNRIWLMNTIIYFAAVSYYSILVVDFTKRFIRERLKMEVLIPVSTVFLLLLNAYVFLNLGRINVPLAQNYARSFDDFTTKIQTIKMKNESDTLWVPFLPNPGVLRNHKITPAPIPLPKNYPFEIDNNFRKFEKYFNVKYKIYMTEDSTLLKKWYAHK
jgi:hypothetical protein